MLAAMSVRQVLNLVEDAEYGPGRRFVVEESLREARIQEHRMQLTDFGHLPADEPRGGGAPGRQLAQGRRPQPTSTAAPGGSAPPPWPPVPSPSTTGIGIDEAVAYVQERKPSADPLPHQRDDLRPWWNARSHLHPSR